MNDDDISPEDKALFRKMAGRVNRMRHGQAILPKRRPAPIPHKIRADEAQVVKDMLSDGYDPTEVATGDELMFARPGLQHGVLRKLRRGMFSIGAELDLHGMTVVEARPALAQFLHDCHQRHVRCVRIIHGKGYGSQQKQPVLKGKVNSWLRQWDEVLAFCSARLADGGTGAVYVLLRAQRDS
ncbi:MAG: Smr/MutS family protein [Gammaproteobacteria bacterium]|nr:Smr/MutS family protein [Gammaproteobacteria bacterium]